jgi:rubrerythrin
MARTIAQRKAYNNAWNKAHKAECAAAARRYRRAHPARVARGKRRHDKQHRFEIQAYMHKWHAENPTKEIHKALTAAWRKSHPEKMTEYRHRRRARKHGSWTAAEWIALKRKCRNRCMACRKSEIVLKILGRIIVPDHIVPLAKGGRNVIGNLQPLCHGIGGCNNRKGIKTQNFLTGENQCPSNRC